jgi:hypothetical protein
MSSRYDDGSKKYLFCDPWNGSKTPAFRKFVRDFRAGADAQFLQDDDHSVWQACIDTDQGGRDPLAEAMPGATQAGYTNAVRRRKRRQNTAFKAIYNHIENERLREMLDALPSDDRRGAAAWALIKTQCDEGTSDLQLEDIKGEFILASIEKDIGYSLGCCWRRLRSDAEH